MIAFGLNTIACIAAIQDERERCARLSGAARAILMMNNSTLQPITQTYFDQVHAPAKAKLGEDVWQRAWAEGRAKSLEQAIAYALKGASDPEREHIP